MGRKGGAKRDPTGGGIDPTLINPASGASWSYSSRLIRIPFFRTFFFFLGFVKYFWGLLTQE